VILANAVVLGLQTMTTSAKPPGRDGHSVNVNLNVYGELDYENDLIRRLQQVFRRGGEDGFNISQPKPGF
jgi:hypothetical protein